MTSLTSTTWWKAATIRALRTALVVAVPYVPAAYIGAVPYVTVALASSLAVIASFITSLKGIAEVTGVIRPWWFAVLSRVVKTVAQATLTGIGTATLITDVPWDSISQMVITAGFGSLLLALLSELPEAPKPVAPDTPSVIVINAATEPVTATLLGAGTAAGPDLP